MSEECLYFPPSSTYVVEFVSSLSQFSTSSQLPFCALLTSSSLWYSAAWLLPVSFCRANTCSRAFRPGCDRRAGHCSGPIRHRFSPRLPGIQAFRTKIGILSLSKLAGTTITALRHDRGADEGDGAADLDGALLALEEPGDGGDGILEFPARPAPSAGAA